MYQNNLGGMYYNGQGVEKDLEKAFYWCEQSANQGYAQAQFHLGNMHEKGKGVEKNLSKAIYLYEQAAKQGHKNAQYVLAIIYLKGEGVSQNDEKARFWLEKATKQGHKKATQRVNEKIILLSNKSIKKLRYCFQNILFRVKITIKIY